ncbi:RICIN domain-containing protein [Streptomyces actinomycinicus]|uniref:RICIN domain-containing protein n=2 Tax=Streptomyces actinomycinicus TaxID=1695166 RepID=A0A937EMX8_9ACTN|nr:RICIN domain-containing protein [Streptomyces actinomycinicus]
MRRKALRASVAAALLVAIGLLTPAPASANHLGVFIYSQSSGLVLDVIGARSDEYQGLVVYPQRDSATNQQFDIRDVGGGQGYQIIARHSHKCLTHYGSAVFQATCGVTPTQRWEFVDLKNGCPPGGGCSERVAGYLIRSKWNGRCLDSANPDFPNPPREGARVQLWSSCAETTDDPKWVNQAWRLESGRGHPDPYAEPSALPPLQPDAKALVDQVVQARRAAGCAHPENVRLDPWLSEVARKHSADLAVNYAKLIDAQTEGQKRGHIGSDGSMPSGRVQSAGFEPAQRPENWSYGTNQSYAGAMDLWMNHDEASKWGHKMAITDCRYTVLGVGTANGHKNRVYWTQNFALR